MNMIDTVFY